MSEVIYLAGSRELIVVDLACSDTAFNVSQWTGELAFAPLGSVFDDTTATFIPALLAANGTTTLDMKPASAFTAGVMQTVDVTLVPGKWGVYCRLTNPLDLNAERPVLQAIGVVEVR